MSISIRIEYRPNVLGGYIKTAVIGFPYCLALLFALHFATNQGTFNIFVGLAWVVASCLTVAVSGWEAVSTRYAHIRRVELLGGWSHIGGRNTPFAHAAFILAVDLLASTALLAFIVNLGRQIFYLFGW